MKAKPYKTGTMPIKWLPHPSANCTWPVPLHQPLNRPAVFMVVNTGRASLRASSPRAPGSRGVQLSWSLQKHGITSWGLLPLRSLEPVSRCCYSTSDSVEGQQVGWHCHRELSLPGPWVLATGQWDRALLPSFHQGISDICIKLEQKTSFSKAPHTIVKKKPFSNLVMFWKSGGGSQKYAYQAY